MIEASSNRKADFFDSIDPKRSLRAKLAVMHNAAQAGMMRSVEAGRGNETALQSRPSTS
jgi:hypothetical protein